jgi:small subunit ribosomal protein S3
MQKNYHSSGIKEIIIQRSAQSIQVRAVCARPGMIIGRKGADIDKAKYGISAAIRKPVQLTVEEERKPDLSAKIVAEGIASQLQRRVAFRKAMKRAVQAAMRAGAKGVKVMVSGRLNGAEIARSEKYHEGQLPLHTFRANIDYHIATGLTTYGIIGVKVWIYRDEAIRKKKVKEGV